MRTKGAWNLTRHLGTTKYYLVNREGLYLVRTTFPEYDARRYVYRDEDPDETIRRCVQELKVALEAKQKTEQARENIDA